MKRVKLAFVIVAIGSMLSMAAQARAATTYVVALPNGTTTGFAPAILALAKGSTLDIVGADVQVHNIVCVKRDRKRRPLCQSRLAGLGETKPVMGVERLAPGTYALLCTLHPQMKADLTVVGA